MEIQAGNLQKINQAYSPSSGTAPVQSSGEMTGDSVSIGACREIPSKTLSLSGSTSSDSSTSPQEVASHSIHMSPLPAASGMVFRSLGIDSVLGFFRGVKSPEAQDAKAGGATAATGGVSNPPPSQAEKISRAIATPLGDSTSEERRSLYDKIMAMIVRTEGGERGSYQKDEALEQYSTVTSWLHKGQSFKDFATLYGRIADNVDLPHAPVTALDIVNNRLYGKREEQEAYLGILENTWDPWDAESMLKVVNRPSLRHSWADLSDAMLALSSAIGRRVVDCFAAKKKLVAIEAFRMLKGNLRKGETLKEAAIELQETLEPRRQVYDYSKLILEGIRFSKEVRNSGIPITEQKLLMKAFSRFGNSYNASGYARDTLTLVNEPHRSSTFEEKSAVMQGIMERDYEPDRIFGSYKVIRDNAAREESLTDMATAFFSFRDLTYDAEEAKKALLYSRNELEKNPGEMEFYTSLFKYTRDAKRAGGFYEAITSEPMLDRQITAESRDDRRGIVRDLISWYMESENYKSPRHGDKMETDKVMESVREDYRLIADLTKPGESFRDVAARFITYISRCKTVHFATEARKALLFTRRDLKDDPREVAYFDALQERTVWVSQAISHYNAFAALPQLEHQIGTESREARRDLFISRLLRYSSWETPKCISLALRDYELITRNLKSGESLQDGEKRIDGWLEKIRSLTTLKERGDPRESLKILGRLKEPGESLDQVLSRTTEAIGALEEKPPYNGFDDMWFTDFTRPIYLGLTFLADSLESGALGNISPKQAFDDLMALLEQGNYIEGIKELMLSRASLDKAAESSGESSHVQQIDDQVIIDGIKLDMRRMGYIGAYLPGDR